MVLGRHEVDATLVALKQKYINLLITDLATAISMVSKLREGGESRPLRLS